MQNNERKGQGKVLKQTLKITREMVISDILGKNPAKSQKLAQEMTNHGLHCASCKSATWETLEMGMLSHGRTDADIEELLERLNEILAEEADLTTISLTKRAAEKFKEVAEEEGQVGWGLRFGDKAGGCSGFEYFLDFEEAPTEEDQVFHSHGVDIFVKKTMIKRLMGCEIDYQDGLMGSGFKISNPNARGSCSCGSSQSY